MSKNNVPTLYSLVVSNDPIILADNSHQWILSYDKQMELIRNGRRIDALNNVNVWTKPRNLGIILCSLELPREDILLVDIDKNIFLNKISRLNLATIFGF